MRVGVWGRSQGLSFSHPWFLRVMPASSDLNDNDYYCYCNNFVLALKVSGRTLTHGSPSDIAIVALGSQALTLAWEPDSPFCP